jgi:NAD(P)-dependent dehydrogenase (short-subunit alcohol dehydrogenase family)
VIFRRMSTLVVIVGPSRGFGKQLVRATLSDHNVVSSTLSTVYILITTSKARTIDMWNSVYEDVRGQHFADDPASNINVYIEEADLCDLESCRKLEQVLRIMFGHFHFQIKKVFMFLNSGSVTPVGDLLTPSATSPSVSGGLCRFDYDVMNHCMLNFVSFTCILRLLIRLVIARAPCCEDLAIRVVNVSSLAAIQELCGMSIYCAVKSARESIIRSLVMEMGLSHPNIDSKFLNYAPGPMETDLVVNDLIGKSCPSNAMKTGSRNFVSALDSARKCVRLISDSDALKGWKSGSHIDFYDEPPFI